MATLMTAASFTEPIEAHIAKGRLEAEGIPAFAAHEHHVWANWVFSQALGGIKIQVAPENAERAEAVLKEHLAGGYEATLEQEFSQIEGNVCPACGSKGFDSKFSLRWLALAIATFGLVGVIFPIRREKRACLKCGHRWKY